MSDEMLAQAWLDLAVQPSYDKLIKVHELENGDLFLPSMQVIEWPKPLRDWIKACDFWKPALHLDGYIKDLN